MEQRNGTKDRPYRVVELFSGVGSQRMAFDIVSRLTGLYFDFIAQCDIDRFAVRSYNAIHGETPNLGDVSQLDTLPDCDILTWSFPCQSLSQAGRKEGMKMGSGTKSSLGWEVLRLLKNSHRPEWLIMENVPAVIWSQNARDFSQIVNTLSALGYQNKWGILRAQDFNVAQTRSRCLMVSHFRAPVPDFPQPIGLNHVLNDYLEPNPDPKFYLSPERVKAIVLQSERERERGNGFRFTPTTPSGVAHTVTTSPDRKCSTFVIEGGD